MLPGSLFLMAEIAFICWDICHNTTLLPNRTSLKLLGHFPPSSSTAVSRRCSEYLGAPRIASRLLNTSRQQTKKQDGFSVGGAEQLYRQETVFHVCGCFWSLSLQDLWTHKQDGALIRRVCGRCVEEKTPPKTQLSTLSVEAPQRYTHWKHHNNTHTGSTTASSIYYEWKLKITCCLSSLKRETRTLKTM